MTEQNAKIDRRSFLAFGTVAASAAATAPQARAAVPDAAAAEAAGQSGAPMVAMVLNVNGQDRPLVADVRTSLLDALREHLALAGSKKGCDHGQCGACTVHIDGRAELSCLTLAIAAQGARVETIEGLAQGGQLHPMQQAFIDNDAFQCGYCTPGQIMSSVACVRTGHGAPDAAIREFMSGNLCRCAAYPNIVAAIKQAAPNIPSQGGS